MLSFPVDGSGRSGATFLQLKEANESALARHAGRSEYPNHGQSVVVGQRLMQAASDIFLGWTNFVLPLLRTTVPRHERIG